MPDSDAASAPRQTQLTRVSWIAEALAVLVDQGIDAVQITALARRLDVTRGSFYWHFENREELLDALIAEWRARNTGVMLSALDGAESLNDGILRLFSVWVDHTQFDPKLDQAVRDWARRDAKLGAVVAREDDSRVDAIARFFAAHGYEHPESFIRARVIYFTQVSYYALGIDEPMADRTGYLDAYFRAFTGRGIDPATRDRYNAWLAETHRDRETGDTP